MILEQRKSGNTPGSLQVVALWSCHTDLNSPVKRAGSRRTLSDRPANYKKVLLCTADISCQAHPHRRTNISLLRALGRYRPPGRHARSSARAFHTVVSRVRAMLKYPRFVHTYCNGERQCVLMLKPPATCEGRRSRSRRPRVPLSIEHVGRAETRESPYDRSWRVNNTQYRHRMECHREQLQ